jgi:hypothetical protein
MDTFKALEVRRVATSPDIERPGDYCFIAKREPIRTYDTMTVERPRGIWTAILMALGIPATKRVTRETLLPQWPDYDAIVMACPHCGQPIGTTKEHRIVSVEPLTIDQPIACAYSRGAGKFDTPTVAFTVKDGKIMPA